MSKCLVVDDVEVTRFTSEQILVSLGMEVKSVAAGDEAIAQLNSTGYDVVLLDWHLRKASGIDVLKHIKATHGNRVKVVMFSGVEGEDKKNEAIAAGADGFLEKPTTKAKLQEYFKGLGLLQ